MSELDDPGRLGAGDPSGTLAALASVPGQVRAAVAAADGVELPPRPPRAVVVCGMGGSGVGGDAVAAAARSGGSVPVVVHRSYGVPAFVDSSTFVIASSYSGETEETLDAFRAAVAAGARGVAVTSGGTLAREAREAGWSVVAVEPVLMPRYALGWVTAAPAAVLERLGVLVLSAGWRRRLPEALEARLASWGPGAPAARNPAKALAQELVGRMPVVWGGDGASGAAAVRWKNDLNENAKVFAHAACLPEADHNESVGHAREGREGRPPCPRALLCLREEGEDPRVAARFEETLREVREDFEVVWETRGAGEDAVARFCDLALLGGFVSTYLGILRHVDPAPIPTVERLKAALARRGPRAPEAAR